MKKQTLHKLWFYYRHGSAYYVTQLIQMINTIILVYFVAGDKIFFIRDVFPHIAIFVIVAVGIGGPLVVFIGWLHYKKAFKSEADIMTRQNPFNTNIMMPVMLHLVRHLKEKSYTKTEQNDLAKLESYILHISNGGKLDQSWNSDPSKERIKVSKKDT
ncbi:MAG: hypothetical protein GTO44_09975 [Hydrotalea flava]|nr:hypothetical protein [Hydrotalea flava]NIN15380.1 hypothetical protein [Hydrotalea flava]